jgi:hypothetical protein
MPPLGNEKILSVDAGTRSLGRSNQSYVPFSRGFREHLPNLSGNAVKLYVELLLAARFAGPHKGEVAVSFADLALGLGMHKQTVHAAAGKLRPHYITWKAAKNQHGITVFTIQKYKSIKDFAVSRAAHSELTATRVPDEKIDQRMNGTLTAPSATDSSSSGLAVPNKLKKFKKEAAAIAVPEKENSVWSFLEILPCGPQSFRSFLESRWASRCGQRPSVLIGATIDAWEAAEGEKPRRVQPLFRALDELRQREKQEAQNAGEAADSIHVFTAEEIPV